MKKYDFIAYAADFVSFLVQNLGIEMSNINNIYLFGSASRGESDAKSDIDLFVDTKEIYLKKKVETIESKFYNYTKFKNYWSPLGIKNEFSIIVGKLDDWTDLKRSIISNGIILYSKYKERFKGEIYTMFKIESKKDKTKDIKFWRKIYGYKQKIGKKDYINRGIIKNLNGVKLANGLFVVPLEKTDIIIKELKLSKVKYKMIQIITDMPINLS